LLLNAHRHSRAIPQFWNGIGQFETPSFPFGAATQTSPDGAAFLRGGTGVLSQLQSRPEAPLRGSDGYQDLAEGRNRAVA
jgi:hypothetical protein